MTHELSPNSAASELLAHPNAFEKSDRSALATVSVFADGDFREPNSGACGRLGNKTPGLVIP